MSKEIIILVGGNGSGKSTFYHRYLTHLNLPFLNADDLAREKWPNSPEEYSYQAAKIIEDKRRLFVSTGQSFCFETVFSHTSKVDFIAYAFSQGYNIQMVVIHIDGPANINIARVANRKKLGGQTVPEDKIINRIPRMLDNVRRSIPFCSTVSFFDSSNNEFVALAILSESKQLTVFKPLPSWVNNCLSGRFTEVLDHTDAQK